MSGGTIGNYGWGELATAADDIQHWIDTGGINPRRDLNATDEENDRWWGPSRPLRPETLARFAEAVELMRNAAAAWHDVDYLLSNDYSEDSWLVNATWTAPATHERNPDA